MSDKPFTEPPQRLLKSPFNGETWPVPTGITPVMYEALLKAGFEPVTVTYPPKAERGNR